MTARAVCAAGGGGRGSRALAALALLAVASGCASRAAPGNRFIHPGEPGARYGPAAHAAHPATLSESVRQTRELQSRATAKGSLLPTIEGRDPALRVALLRLAGAETAENHRLVAAAYVSVGIPDYAYKHFRRALRLVPCDGKAYEGLARLWRDWGQPDLALGDVYRALSCDGRSPAVYNTLGTVLQALGQKQNATDAFEYALRLDPGAVFALNNLCYLSLQDGKDAAAAAFCERALALDPANAVASNNLALAYAIEGDVGRAEKILLGNASIATGHYNVGVLRLSLGRYAGASQAFDRAAAAQPAFWLARRRAIQARIAEAAEPHNADR